MEETSKGKIDIKKLYGQHETQVSNGEEADLHKHFLKCEKNPGHTYFIPIDDLMMDHLPEEHRDPDLLDLIKATADLTVRVSVTMVSPQRPEFWPDSTAPYPFHNCGGSTETRSGSGEMRVFQFVDGCGSNGSGSYFNELGEKYERKYKTCPCEKCGPSASPSRMWWEINVHTATHVVFDELEASHTSCRLYFDRRNCPMVTLDKASIYYVYVDRDLCGLKYITCDTELGNKLFQKARKCAELRKIVREKYKSKTDVKLTFAVSHPHGCPKQVSIGQWTDNHKIGQVSPDIYLTKLTYTTSTCPGSSGARIHCVGFVSGHVHTGALDSGLNYSGICICRS